MLYRRMNRVASEVIDPRVRMHAPPGQGGRPHR